MSVKLARHLLIAAAAAGALFTMQPAFAAGTAIKVILGDTTADIDLKATLGMGLNGDMTKATMTLKAEPNDVPAGVVNFEVENSSKATIHEMIVAAVADVTKPMPFNAEEYRVDEDKAGDIGEVSELDPGKSGKLSVTLKPGTYLLYCNVPGHYMSGMWATITVK